MNPGGIVPRKREFHPDGMKEKSDSIGQAGQAQIRRRRKGLTGRR